MTQRHTKSVPMTTGAEAFLEQLRALGIRYMFANTGTNHGPIIEALAKTAKERRHGVNVYWQKRRISLT
jgi:hypothetical protein